MMTHLDKNIDNEMQLKFISKSSNEAFARVAVAAFAIRFFVL